MKIIKRDGREVPFDPEKIRAAVSAANAEVSAKGRLDKSGISSLTASVTEKCEELLKEAEEKMREDMN